MPRFCARPARPIAGRLCLWLAATACVALFSVTVAQAATSRHKPRASIGARHLSSTPPLPLGSSTKAPARPGTTSKSRPSSGSPADSASSTRLPATGYDAATAALLGAGMLAAGFGLRRLTADARRP